MTIAGVAVTVTDDDAAGAAVSETTLTVAEGGSATYTVRLNTQPTSDVVITVSSGNTDVTASPATLTFTSSNWGTAQTVTVSAAQDADAVNDAASIAHAVVDASSADEFDAVTIAGVAVTVTDDDDAGAAVSETTVTVTEGGSATYTVRLNTQPTSDVVISVTASGSSDVTVSPATLTFTTANWSTAQTVTVSAAQDADAVNDAASITHAVVDASSANEYDAVTIARGGGDRHRRRRRRGGGVRDHGDGDRGRQRLLHGEAEHATHLQRGDRRNRQRQLRRDGVSGHSDLHDVQLEHGEDGDGGCRPGRRRGERRGVHRPRGGGRQQRRRVRRRDHRRVAVTVTDDDAAGAAVSETTLTVAEGGSATYTVRLNTQPTSDVVITVSSGNTDVTASPATLTFTSSNWGTAQTVTVAAAQDADAVNDAASIAHAVVDASSADEFDAVTIAGVAVTVTDDDAAGAAVSETTLTVTEGGSATYTVRLNTQPTSDVVIGVTASGNTDVTVSPATLTFTTANWDTAQTVTVAAAQDADAVNDAASIAHAVVDASSADEFDAVTIAGVAVTVTDDDAAGAAVSETTLTVAEGGSATYTVRLNTQPTSDVVISVTASGNTDVTVSPARLTFTTANWGTAQTVTVAAAQDADAVNDAASIAHAVVDASSATSSTP